MKDNAFSDELSLILHENLITTYAIKDHIGAVHVDYRPAIDAILKLMAARLPKEKDGEMGEDRMDYEDGWNDCLAEVKQALDIESEGTSK